MTGIMGLDKFQQLAWDAKVVAVILGNGREFELIDLNAPRMREQRAHELRQKDFAFIGVIGIVNGRSRVALEVPLDDKSISAVSQAFLQRIGGSIQRIEDAVNLGDSAPWLQRLYSLPDIREWN